MKPELNITLENCDNEIVIREGKALELKEPVAIKINGVLDSPLKWLEKKVPSEIETDCHILVDRENASIKLTTNDSSFYADIITGKLVEHPDFKKFEINTGSHFTNFELAELFKMNRSCFENHSTAMKLVTDLKSFKAKVDKEIEKANNDRGNVKLHIAQFVETNLPEKFYLVIPMFKGYKKERIEVEIYIHPQDLTCALISPHANDLCAEIKDRAIDEVLTSIKELSPDIPILEI